MYKTFPDNPQFSIGCLYSILWFRQKKNKEYIQLKQEKNS